MTMKTMTTKRMKTIKKPRMRRQTKKAVLVMEKIRTILVMMRTMKKQLKMRTMMIMKN